MRPSVESDPRASAPANNAANNAAGARLPKWLRLTSAALLASGLCSACFSTWAHPRAMDCWIMTLAHCLALCFVSCSTRYSLELASFQLCVMTAASVLVPVCFELAWTRLSTGAFLLTPKPSFDIMRLPGKALGFYMFMTAYQVRWTRLQCHHCHGDTWASCVCHF
jgi:hypothetical protein